MPRSLIPDDPELVASSSLSRYQRMPRKHIEILNCSSRGRTGIRGISYTLGSAMHKRFFDELEVGETHETPGITVTNWHVMNFAAVSMDYFELHTNDEYARQTQFGRRVAHGLLGLAIADGLKHRSTFQVAAIASLHWSWDFTGPIHVGDTIRARLRVAGKRASKSKTDRGIVTVEYEVLNQLDEVVQKGANRMMVKKC